MFFFYLTLPTTPNNYGDYATIEGGTGNDTIDNTGDKVLVKYNAGDGNDTIYGFKENSTLEIGESNYTTIKSENNVIATVGDEKIILQGAATLSTVNIRKVSSGNLYEPVSIRNGKESASLVGGNNDDTIFNGNGGNYITIAGNDGNDSISNRGRAV